LYIEAARLDRCLPVPAPLGLRPSWPSDRQVREILPRGADAALELVGTPTLPDTLRSVRVHGMVCFTGMLSNQWTVRDFYPLDYLPTGVRLTAYKGDAADLPPRVLQDFLDAVAAGTAAVPIGRVCQRGGVRLD
jgi:NADPH:quinone reductase